MAAATRVLRKGISPSLVVILGATGTGKSKLAIEIGKRLNGEIISADSMQVTTDCLCGQVGIEYLNNSLLKSGTQILGSIDLGSTNCSWEPRLCPPLSDLQQGSDTVSEKGGTCESRVELEKLGGPELHRRLKEVDPDMAAILHPHDARKIARSLQVYMDTGVPHSRLLEEQRGQDGGDCLGGPLRFQDPCIFWLHYETNALDERLDKRVDQMLSLGLIDELKDFHQRFNDKKIKENSQDYQHGIFQSIGFKEFHEYLTASENISQEERDKLKIKGIESLKQATRRYARKQNKWVRNRFLKSKSH
uniref:tRNA dimethylallyltransferase n=1 Tax=Sinocyclocheilus grahami TaxID=75366 RepID=A0A672R146_SINGR